jgi:hypothetical protein
VPIRPSFKYFRYVSVLTAESRPASEKPAGEIIAARGSPQRPSLVSGQSGAQP